MIYINRIPYTLQEDNFLRENYKQLSIEDLSKQLNRSINSIYIKLNQLKLYTKKWSKEEIKILESCEGKSVRESQKILNNRSYDSVYSKAKKLKINLINPNNLWTKEEINILLENINGISTFEEIHKLLPHRSITSIKDRFCYMNIRITNPNYIPLKTISEYNRNKNKQL
jgi:hypothetical protein